MPALLPQPSPKLSKTLPSCCRKHPPRQRNPPKINRHPRLAHPNPRHPHNRRGHLHPRPQHRRLNHQHPAQWPQNPRRLRSRLQQRNHLRLLQNRPQLRSIPRRMPGRRPHQPTKPTRKPQRHHSPRPPVRHNPRIRRRPPPKPPRLKPLGQPLHPSANPPQPLKQQQRQRLAQPSPTRPAAHRPAQSADHDRKARKRGGVTIHPPFHTTPPGWTQQKSTPVSLFFATPQGIALCSPLLQKRSRHQRPTRKMCAR